MPNPIEFNATLAGYEVHLGHERALALACKRFGITRAEGIVLVIERRQQIIDEAWRAHQTQTPAG